MAEDVQGQFLALLPNGTMGLMQDFSFRGPDGGGFPLPPITNWEVFPNVSVDLLSWNTAETVVASNFIFIQANVLFRATGFDPTPGIINFTATRSSDVGSTISFVFSAAQSAAPVSVPEPASMMLLGTGLFGLAAMSRRRFAKQ